MKTSERLPDLKERTTNTWCLESKLCMVKIITQIKIPLKYLLKLNLVRKRMAELYEIKD